MKNVLSLMILLVLAGFAVSQEAERKSVTKRVSQIDVTLSLSSDWTEISKFESDNAVRWMANKSTWSIGIRYPTTYNITSTTTLKDLADTAKSSYIAGVSPTNFKTSDLKLKDGTAAMMIEYELNHGPVRGIQPVTELLVLRKGTLWVFFSSVIPDELAKTDRPGVDRKVDAWRKEVRSVFDSIAFKE